MRWWLVFAIVGCRDTSVPPASVGTCATGDRAACRRDCDAGSDAACDKLVAAYLKTGGTTGRHDAAELTRGLCEGGRRYFCPSLAFVLANGDGIAADRVRAIELFRTTCKDDPKACSEYGNLYLAGRGVPHDPELAQLLLDLACTQHDADACRDLARLRAAR